MPLVFLESEEFPFGEGLFETLPWKNGPVLFEAHWERLRASCRALNYSFPFQRDLILKALHEKIQDESILRIVYRNENGSPSLSAQILKPRAIPKSVVLLPVTISPHPLARHKVTQRETYEALRKKALDAGAYDALLLSPEGNVLETTRANIFVKVNGVLKTPPLNGQILPGVVRNQVIQSMNAEPFGDSPRPGNANLGTVPKISIREELITQNQLAAAEEIFITNSVIGIVPASLIR